MGLPTKCMHFVGSPGRRGYNTPMSEECRPLNFIPPRAGVLRTVNLVASTLTKEHLSPRTRVVARGFKLYLIHIKGLLRKLKQGKHFRDFV